MTSTVEIAEDRQSDDIIITGSTWTAIWHMSWPLFLNMATISFATFADIWVAGKLGANSQAAIGLCGQIWFFMIILTVALSAATTALVSRYFGARDLETTIEAARQSIVFATIFGIISCIAGLIVCRPLLHWLGASPQVEELGWSYLRFDLVGQIPYTVLWVANSIFRAKGNARAPLVVMAIVTAMVIVLDFILSLWPFHLGIQGIGMSWLIAGSVGFAISINLLKSSELGPCLDLRPVFAKGLSKEWFVRFMRIGIPACMEDLCWVGGNLVFFLIFAHTSDPTSCQAAWAVGLRLEENLAGMPIYAFAMAVATIVGQNLGAGLPERAERAGWHVAGLGACLNLVVGLILFFAAQPIAQMMSTDKMVILYSSQYLQVLGLSEPFVAVWNILFGAMRGAGYTRWPMLTAIIVLILIRLPLAWYLTICLHLGPIGTWYSIAITAVLIGGVAAWRFYTGVWKLQKV